MLRKDDVGPPRVPRSTMPLACVQLKAWVAVSTSWPAGCGSAPLLLCRGVIDLRRCAVLFVAPEDLVDCFTHEHAAIDALARRNLSQALKLVVLYGKCDCEFSPHVPRPPLTPPPLRQAGYVCMIAMSTEPINAELG